MRRTLATQIVEKADLEVGRQRHLGTQRDGGAAGVAGGDSAGCRRWSGDEDADGWSLRTHDGSLGAQFEHTVVVTHGAPVVLTASAA